MENNIEIEVLNNNVQLSKELIKAANNDKTAARIFYNRGITDPDKIRQMLDITLYKPTSYLEFEGIKRAAALIARAISEKQKIAIYGDYDVDGVTSTVALFECLSNFTNNLIYHVPDRFTEGYGMNIEVVNKMKQQDVSLIITCDCGISNLEEIQAAKNLGMKVIITDHHKLPEELPDADVILNPKLLKNGHRACNISGCVMAYYLCCSIYEHYKLADKANQLLDLVVLSIIADVVPLIDENRYLLKLGLQKFFNTQRMGLVSLFKTIGKDCAVETEEDIAFQIAPRINAAGRMHSARLPVELLLTKDESKAMELAKKIDQLNTERKRVQQGIVEEAKQQVLRSKLNKSVIALYGEFWHHGIIGIAAGKIAEYYMKPTIMLSLKEDNQTVVGSARSIDGINIYDIIKECSGNLLKFGGHSQAAGLSLKKEKVNIFIEDIERCARNKHRIIETPKIKVDMDIELSDINEEIYNSIRTVGPYGEGFRAPLFLSEQVFVISDRVTEKNHHIMVLEAAGGERIQAVKWFGDEKSFRGKKIDFIYKISKRKYNDIEQLQLTGEYLLDSIETMSKVFDMVVIDYRKMDIKALLDKNNGIMVFYEGIGGSAVNMTSFDRITMEKSKELLLLSLPTNIDYLREIIAYINPEKLYLNFTAVPSFQFKDFVMKALGLIKHIAVNKDKKYYLEWFASKLCIEDSLAKTLLKYLSESGKIAFDIRDDILNITLENKKVNMQSKVTEKVIRNALKEKQVFYESMNTVDIDDFLEYLNR